MRDTRTPKVYGSIVFVVGWMLGMLSGNPVWIQAALLVAGGVVASKADVTVFGLHHR